MDPAQPDPAELALREAIFEHLDKLVTRKPSLTRQELTDFEVNGKPAKLIDRNKGIWNPQDLQATLSIMSKPDSQYDDEAIGDSMYAYAYREGNKNGDNTKLRRAFELKMPIILLRWIRAGIYVPIFPVYVIQDDPDRQRFMLALDESMRDVADPDNLTPIERRYSRKLTKQRLHQPEFRARVLLAYGNRCTMCRISYAQLLDAAHIIADSADHGAAEVANGLCLCKIHHAAYDANLLGISPDHQIHLSPKLQEDQGDAPMLRHGLQGLRGEYLALPSSRKDRPSQERIIERFEEFQAAS
ncbi:HNH endonuclease [Nocardia sp. NPDC048505]|uniref:HNH endonuclease n=1 Tax=unclassified Nocardia TaxID=2637762 RepID=UPI003406B5FC